MIDKERLPITHELKIWPQYFSAVCEGLKTFEYRKNDRDFQLGDNVILREWDPGQQCYTDSPSMHFTITYVLPIPNSDFVVFSIFPTVPV